MMKILVPLVLGGALGFGGGIYFSAHHPESASKVAATEQRDALQAELKFAQTSTDQLQKAIDAKKAKPDSGMFRLDTLQKLHDQEQSKAIALQAELNGQ
ncbi:MAG TPA: hypothetical protein VHY37_13525 [Tepidisphaeraceae bacterium]|jgi:hypothetical protein|nr:hypothetical protein [Tepidisphaeraceae bacterium]